ncbi:MAG: flagellar export chaperone FliS [Candidatus Berkiella sp.]
MNPNYALKQYQHVSIETGILNADPYRLIQILLESAIEKLTIARGFIERNNIHDKGIAISFAISIIETLESSLNEQEGGEIAKNLKDLYTYMLQELIQVNLHNDINKLDGIIQLINTIKSGWDNMPQAKVEDAE